MRSAISVLLVIILIPISLVIAVSLTLQTSILQASFVKSILAQSGLYTVPFDSELGPFLVKSLQPQEDESDAEPSITLPEEHVIRIVAVVQTVLYDELGPEYLQQKIEQVIDPVWAWLTGQTDILSVTITLDQEKIRQVVFLGKEQLFLELENYPKCQTLEEWENNQGVVTCIPPEFTREYLDAMLLQSGFDLEKILAERIPTEIDITEALQANDGYAALLEVRAGIILFTKLVVPLLLVGWISLFLLLIFLKRSEALLRWIGALLTVGFFLPAFVCMLLLLVVPTVAEIYVFPNLQEIPPVMINVVKSGALAVVQELGVRFFLFGFLPFILGVVLLVVSRFVDISLLFAKLRLKTVERAS